VRRGEGFGRTLGVDHELADAGPVAQIDEDEPAMVAARVRPAREDQPLADLLGADVAHIRSRHFMPALSNLS